VLYALSEADALQDMARTTPHPGSLRRDGKARVVCLLQPDDSSSPTLAYLRSVYNSPGARQSQWSNFVERLRGLAAARGIRDVPAAVHEVRRLGRRTAAAVVVAHASRHPLRCLTALRCAPVRCDACVFTPHRLPTQHHFLSGAPLHALKDELLLWASCRGQLLARTVAGMMSFRTALLALAAYENPHLMPRREQQQLDTLTEQWHQHQLQLAQLAQRQQHLAHVVQHEEQQLARVRERLGQSGCGEVSLLLPEQQQYLLQQKELLQQQLARHRAEQQQVAADSARAQAGFSGDQQQQLDALRAAAAHCSALRDVLLQDLVDCKYSLVVSSQNLRVFAAPAESAVSMRAAWLVHSMHRMRQLHPALKVGGARG
jgi:hypothetical protein